MSRKFVRKKPPEPDLPFPPVENLKLGQQFKHRRNRLQFSREKMAEYANISEEFLFDIESGRKGMSLVTFKNFLDAFGVTADEVFGRYRLLSAEKDLRRLWVKRNIIAHLEDCDKAQIEAFAHIARCYAKALKLPYEPPKPEWKPEDGLKIPLKRLKREDKK